MSMRMCEVALQWALEMAHNGLSDYDSVRQLRLLTLLWAALGISWPWSRNLFVHCLSPELVGRD